MHEFKATEKYYQFVEARKSLTEFRTNSSKLPSLWNVSNVLKCEGRFLAAPASIKVSALRVGLVQDTHRLCCEKEDHRFSSHFFSSCPNLLVTGSHLPAGLNRLVLSFRIYYDLGIPGIKDFLLHLHQSKSAHAAYGASTDYAVKEDRFFYHCS